MPGLNHKQIAFATHYAAGPTAGNATASAIAAGYSARTAHSAGPRLLDHVGVRALIQSKSEKALAKVEVKGEKVLAELATFAFADPASAYDENGALLWPLSRMPEKTRRAIASIETIEQTSPEGVMVGVVRKVKFWDKPKGLDSLGRNEGLFKETVVHELGDSLAELLAVARAPGGDE